MMGFMLQRGERTAAKVTSQGASPADIAISGGSFAGLALALALARSLGPELTILVLDREAAGASPDPDDPRAVAISASSRRMLEALGVWTDLVAVAEPVRRIEITDSGLDAGIRPVLLAWDNGIEEFDGPSTAAHIVPVPALSEALARAVAATPSIEMARPVEVEDYTAGPYFATARLAGGAARLSRLLVGADGRGSPLREAAGIKSVGWPYAQVGIATTVEHELDHGGTAVQHFLPSGPFALLPLPGRRTCVTWSEADESAQRMMALDDAAFLEELQTRAGWRLGELTLDGPRASWPLGSHLARSLIAPRLAVVGDAARSVHPIAGQGVNLGFRDVAALAEAVVDGARLGLEVGDATSLERYERWRRADGVQSAAAFSALNTLFSNDWMLLRTVRDAGLGIVDRLPGLKSLLVAEAAGLTGDVPRLLKGEPL